jgi:hypothetical protein
MPKRTYEQQVISAFEQETEKYLKAFKQRHPWPRHSYRLIGKQCFTKKNSQITCDPPISCLINQFMAEKDLTFKSFHIVGCGRRKLFSSSVLLTSWNDFFSKNHKFHFTVKAKPTKTPRFPLEKPVDWRDCYSKVMSELIA